MMVWIFVYEHKEKARALCSAVEECWVEYGRTSVSSELGVDFEAHYHKAPFAVTAKAARKRARSLGRHGGKTVILMDSDLF
jgi:hypothetical protein